MRYYYFGASLPVLNFGEPPPSSVEDFLKDCDRLLDPGDARAVRSVVDEDAGGRPVADRTIRRWLEFERRFRNEAAWVRATQANKDPATFIRGERAVDPQVLDLMVRALQAPDPLTAEWILDEGRWRLVEEMSTGHHYDLFFLAAYAVKLKILNRHRQVQSPRGRHVFEGYKEEVVSLI